MVLKLSEFNYKFTLNAHNGKLLKNINVTRNK